MVRLLAAAVVFASVLMVCDKEPSGPVINTGPISCNKIDVFTSASKMLKVDSIVVYDTFAVVTWWEKWSDSGVTSYQIEYGLDSTQLTNIVELKPYIEQIHRSDTIHPLLPNTPYYLRFYRDYHQGTIRITNIPFPEYYPFTTCPAQ